MSEPSPLVQAQQQFAAKIPFGTITAEIVAILDACDCVTAHDVVAPIASPPYSRAIVEGYLVRTSDTQGASEQQVKTFKVVGATNPGDRKPIEPGANEGVQVVTGSIVPDGPYSIVRQWEAKTSNAGFTISRPFPPRFFIEDKGCDVKEGQTIFPRGKRLNSWDVGVAASLGMSYLPVAKKPKVMIFGSGDEVIPHTSGLIPGAIYDCNSPMLATAIRANGGEPFLGGIQRDDFDAFVSAVNKNLDSVDMIVIAGGTAVGGRDFMSDMLRATGELIVDGVPMKSGRPLIMGIAKKKPIVCVAGHPPEALRGFQLFGVLAMRRLMGQDLPLPEDVPIK